MDQPPAGWIRDSDYQVHYEFSDESGVVHSGRDVLPPAKPPPEEKIEILYWLSDPSVSRIASQRSGTPLAGILFGVGTILWVTIRFIRERREASRLESEVHEQLPRNTSTITE